MENSNSDHPQPTWLPLLLKRMDQVETHLQCVITSMATIIPKISKRIVDDMEISGCMQPIIMTKSQLDGLVQDALSHRTKPAMLQQKEIIKVSMDMQVDEDEEDDDAFMNALESNKFPQPQGIVVTSHTIRSSPSQVETLPALPASKILKNASAPKKLPTSQARSRPTAAVRVHPPITPSVTSSAMGAAPQTAPPAEDNFPLYLWGNAWHKVPVEYEIPKESLEILWRQWCCGDVDRGYPPLRRLESSDMATLNNRKRLSDLRFLMRTLEESLQHRNVWKEAPTLLEADQMLLAVRDELPMTKGKAENGRKRSLDVMDMKWHSVVTLMRQAKKNKMDQVSESAVV